LRQEGREESEEGSESCENSEGNASCEDAVGWEGGDLVAVGGRA